MPDHPEMGRPGRLLLRLLLRLYPREFRADFRAQWMIFLQEQRGEARYRMPLLGALRFWWDVLADVGRSMSQIRREGWNRCRTRGSVRSHQGGARQNRDPRDPAGRDRESHPRKERFAVESLAQDLRFAFRTLRRRPLYAGVAILTLGLGIGAATAMFSVVDGVLLAKVQYRDPDRLMTIWQRLGGRQGYTEAGETRLMYLQYKALRDQSTAFQDVAVYAADWGESSLGGGVRPELVNVGPTTASLLPVLGITPALGRWFSPEEEGEGAGDRARVTVMSHDIWVRRFASDPGVLGSSVVINGISYTVIGVLPPGFRMQWLSASITGADDPGPRDFWVPVGSPEWGEAPGSTMWEAVGRLIEGVTLDQARSETSQILTEAWPGHEASALIMPRTAEEIRGLDSPILLLFGATGLLLLIACGNVGALALGESAGRTQEVATRVAIGAGFVRILRQLMTESVVLGVLGSVLGASLAVVGTRALVALAPPVPRLDQVHVAPVVLAFAGIVGTLSGLVFGLAPALVSAKRGVGSTLKVGGRTRSRRRGGLGRWVLAGEIGLTVILLVAGGLLARSLSELLTVDLGFNPRNLASVEVGLPDARYGWEIKGAAWRFMDQVMREMESIPGVDAVSAANMLPFPDSPSEWATRLTPQDSTYLMPELYNVAPGYLGFMGIPILEGRGFGSSDDADAPPVAVVNRSLARALWGDRSPLGQELIYPMGPVTVVGVAGDTRQTALQNEPPLSFYVPFSQHARANATFAARTRGQSEDVLTAMREALWRVDPELAITASGTLEGAITASASEERYRALLMTLFALLATVLAAVGIGGVTARQVAQQTREVGIRKALGAEDGTLLVDVMRRTTLLGLLGVALGLAGAFLLRPLLEAFLFGVGSFDGLTYGGIGALFLFVSVVSGYFPARRLLKVDPATVLREE